MNIGERVRLLREVKQMSQREVEEMTGLLRCYISRVENGHTIPSVETLEKLARAFGLHVYQLVYDPEEASGSPSPRPFRVDESGKGDSLHDQRYARRLIQCLANLDGHQKRMLMYMAAAMASRRRTKARPSRPNVGPQSLAVYCQERHF